MKIYKKIIISIFVTFLFLMLATSVQAANVKKENITTAGVIVSDLKARTSNGEWKDSISSVAIGTVIEFKVTVNVPRDYAWLGVLVELPATSEDDPAFNYVIASMSPVILDLTEGISYAYNDIEVAWNWLNVGPSFDKTMTFKATIKKSGTQTVRLTVGGLYAGEDEGSDSLTISTTKSKSINFVFGEKIIQIFQILEKIQIKLHNLRSKI